MTGWNTRLLLVILATAKRKAEVGSQVELVIAGTLGLCLFTAGSVSTIGVNPTRTLATGLTYLLRGSLNQQEQETASRQLEDGALAAEDG